VSSVRNETNHLPPDISGFAGESARAALLAHLLSPVGCQYGVQVKLVGDSLFFRGEKASVELGEIMSLFHSTATESDVFLTPDLSDTFSLLKTVRSGAGHLTFGAREVLNIPNVYSERGVTATAGAVIVDRVRKGGVPAHEWAEEVGGVLLLACYRNGVIFLRSSR
jgi:hypothetical protein